MNLFYLGPEHSYSYQAAMKIKSVTPDYNLVPCEDIDAIFSGLENPDTFAVVPLENNISGKIVRVDELMRAKNYDIIETLPISIVHCLLSKKEDLSFCNKIYLDEHSQNQCKEFLRFLNLMKFEIVENPSIAMEKAVTDLDSAAIGNIEAGEALGLNILNIDIGDLPENWTTFGLIKGSL